MTLTAALPFLIAVTAATAAECVRVSGDHILGKDLKAFREGYEQVADDAVLGLTPAAGVRRTLNARELSGLGGSEEGGVCVERALQEVTPTEIEAAMRKALARPQVEIAILDYIRTALPAGVLEFTPAGLSRPPPLHPDAPVQWRGRVKFAGGRSAMIWARVLISEQAEWMEAAETLHPGDPVREEQLVAKSGRQFPMSKPGPVTAGEIAGRRPRRTIAAGQVLTAAMFEAPPLIRKGDIVAAEVESGAVALHFDARAETAGRAQDRIIVVDQAKGQRLQARVVEKGKVVIDVKNQAGAPVRGARNAGDTRRVD